MRELGARDARAAVDARHMVEHDVHDHLDAMRVAVGHHRRELRAAAALGLDLVRDGLVVRPPLVAGDVLHCGADLHVAVASCRGEQGALE